MGELEDPARCTPAKRDGCFCIHLNPLWVTESGQLTGPDVWVFSASNLPTLQCLQSSCKEYHHHPTRSLLLPCSLFYLLTCRSHLWLFCLLEMNCFISVLADLDIDAAINTIWSVWEIPSQITRDLKDKKDAWTGKIGDESWAGTSQTVSRGTQPARCMVQRKLKMRR